MSKRLEKARAKTKALPDSHFGKGTGLTFEDLPTIKNKVEKVKKTYTFRKDSIARLEEIARENKVSIGDLICDLIDRAV